MEELKYAFAESLLIEHGARAAEKQINLFDEGLAKGAVFDPTNGATELINHIAGTNIGKLHCIIGKM